MEIRLYRPSDESACLAIVDAVDPGRRTSFESFLKAPRGTFLVVEHGDAVIGCGGFDPAQAELTWGMIRKDLQRQGLGRYLLLYRIKEMGRIPGLVSIRALVPPAYSAFYEKNGLKPTGNISEGGFMEFRMKLQVCS